MTRWRSLLMELVAKFKHLMESGMRRHLTRGGLLFSATIVVVAFAAFASANNLIFLILAAMLATLMVSGFISRLSLAGLELEFLHPEHISARRKVAGRIIVHNDKIWIPSFSIQLAGTLSAGMESVLYFPTIPPKAKLEDTVECYFPKRGRYTENSFCFSTCFPFGFTERRIHVRVQQDILVYPSVDPQAGLRADAVLAERRHRGVFSRAGAEIFIASARMKPLRARVTWIGKPLPTPANSRSGNSHANRNRRFCCFSIWIRTRVPTFEAAVDASAYLSWNLAQRGARLRFSTQQFAAHLPEQGDVYTILKYLALVKPVRGKLAPPPDDQHGFQVVISVAPDRLADSGWAPAGGGNAFVVNPAALARF